MDTNKFSRKWQGGGSLRGLLTVELVAGIERSVTLWGCCQSLISRISQCSHVIWTVFWKLTYLFPPQAAPRHRHMGLEEGLGHREEQYNTFHVQGGSTHTNQHSAGINSELAPIVSVLPSYIVCLRLISPKTYFYSSLPPFLLNIPITVLSRVAVPIKVGPFIVLHLVAGGWVCD